MNRSNLFRRFEADIADCARNNSNLVFKTTHTSLLATAGAARYSISLVFAGLRSRVYSSLQPIRFLDSFNWDKQTYALCR